MFVYQALEKENDDGAWTLVDCIYFLSMTMSTVGYGDLSPSHDGARWWTVFMIFFGIGFVFPYLASWLDLVSGPITLQGREWMERLFPQKGIDIDGDGGCDYKVPRHPVIYYSKNLLPSVLLNLAIQCISAGIFCAVETAWSFQLAFYHCLVTATTVGYGDVTITTQYGRAWASAHMLISVMLLAELISTLGSLSEDRKVALRRVKQLQMRADKKLLAKVMHRARTMRRDDNGGDFLDHYMHVAFDDTMPAHVHIWCLDRRGRDADGTISDMFFVPQMKACQSSSTSCRCSWSLT